MLIPVPMALVPKVPYPKNPRHSLDDNMIIGNPNQQNNQSTFFKPKIELFRDMTLSLTQ